jgi:centrosomal protein CEP41
VSSPKRILTNSSWRRAMLDYKSKEGKLLVVYDFDESTAPAFATALAQRGYDNVFLLSGGMRLVQVIRFMVYFQH